MALCIDIPYTLESLQAEQLQEFYTFFLLISLHLQKCNSAVTVETFINLPCQVQGQFKQFYALHIGHKYLFATISAVTKGDPYLPSPIRYQLSTLLTSAFWDACLQAPLMSPFVIVLKDRKPQTLLVCGF